MSSLKICEECGNEICFGFCPLWDVRKELQLRDEGFRLAMDFIDKTPVDPDIFGEQAKAWIKLQDFINKHKEELK